MNSSSDNSNLLSYSRNITSEHGEDGVSKRIFEIIGASSRSCVELGALKHNLRVKLRRVRAWLH